MNRFFKLTCILLINRIVVENGLDSKVCETVNYTFVGRAYC